LFAQGVECAGLVSPCSAQHRLEFKVGLVVEICAGTAHAEEPGCGPAGGHPLSLALESRVYMLVSYVVCEVVVHAAFAQFLLYLSGLHRVYSRLVDLFFMGLPHWAPRRVGGCQPRPVLPAGCLSVCWVLFSLKRRVCSLVPLPTMRVGRPHMCLVYRRKLSLWEGRRWLARPPAVALPVALPFLILQIVVQKNSSRHFIDFNCKRFPFFFPPCPGAPTFTLF
jgi:hypothetical protein